MELHGHTTIELTDIHTGEVERYEDDNIVTNLLQHAYNDQNAFNITKIKDNYTSNSYSFPIAIDDGVIYIGNDPEKYLREVMRDLFLYPTPINKLIGGIRLYSSPLDEDANKFIIPESVGVTGFASDNIYTGSELKRGNRNLTESGEIANGYKFVWEFPSDRGNGTIASVGLTDVYGGKFSHGTFPILTMIEKGNTRVDVNTYAPAFQIVDYDETTGIILQAKLGTRSSTASTALELTEYGPFYPDNNIQVFTSNYIESLPVIRKVNVTLQNSSLWFGMCKDKSTGRFYVLTTSSSSANSTLYLTTLGADYSVISSVALPNKLPVSNVYYAQGMSAFTSMVIRNGWLYYAVPSSTAFNTDNRLAYIYKINLSDVSNYKVVVNGLLMANYGPATSDIWLDRFTNELHYGFLTIDELDNVYQRPANARGQMATTSGYTYTYGAATIYGGYEYQLPNSPYVYVIGRIQNNINNYVYSGVACYYRIGSLVTINNLSRPVEKTSDKTMKITYTIYAV